MSEITKNIIETLSRMGTEKIQEAGSVKALATLIKEYGVEASPEQVLAAIETVMRAVSGRKELDEAALAKVAGGLSSAVAVPLVPGIVDEVKWVAAKIKGKTE